MEHVHHHPAKALHLWIAISRSSTSLRTTSTLLLKSSTLHIMKLIKSNIERKTGAGSATLLPEEPEDMVSESVSTTECLLVAGSDQRDSGTHTT